jgi:hypothetical protein
MVSEIGRPKTSPWAKKTIKCLEAFDLECCHARVWAERDTDLIVL